LARLRHLVDVHESEVQELTCSLPAGGFDRAMDKRMLRSLSSVTFSLTLGSACFAESVVLDVLSVVPGHDTRTGRPIVQLVLGQKSKQALTAFSSAEIGRKVELRVDDRIVAAPAIREPLSTSIQISDVGWTDEVAAAIASELAKPNAKIELGPIKE
jgi:hypothetical protein